MIPAERKERLLVLLKGSGYLTVDALSAALFVSPPTVRRDLKELEIDGAIRRTHGGAAYIGPGFTAEPFRLRDHTNLEAKQRIGKLAAGIVQNGNSLFIYTSSTCLCFARALESGLGLNVLTNSLPIAQVLSERSNVLVECPAGRYDARHASIYGPEACELIKRRNARFLFVSCGGISASRGVTIPASEDLPLMDAFRQQAEKVVLLMDHTKFDVEHYYRAFRLSDIDILVTDRPLPDDLRAACVDAGIQLMQPRHIRDLRQVQ